MAARMMLIISGRYGTVVSYLRLMFCTPSPTLETSREPSFRRRLGFGAGLPVPEGVAWNCEVAIGAELRVSAALTIAVFVRKSRRPIAVREVTLLALSILFCSPFRMR
jgi:hypothetical protein